MRDTNEKAILQHGDEPVQHDGPLPVKEVDNPQNELQRQEEMLKQKFGNMPMKGGQSALLQKKIQQRKFWDSGDYNMAKQKGGLKFGKANKEIPAAAVDKVSEAEKAAAKAPPQLKVSIDPSVTLRQPLSPTVEEPAAGLSVAGSADDAPSGTRSPTGMEIPRPDTVPQRKSSIIFPGLASKLSPQPLLHHAPGENALLGECNE